MTDWIENVRPIPSSSQGDGIPDLPWNPVQQEVDDLQIPEGHRDHVQAKLEAMRSLHPSSQVSPAKKVRINALLSALAAAENGRTQMLEAGDWYRVTDREASFPGIEREAASLISKIKFALNAELDSFD